jgi:hypothetical protein
MESPAPNEPTGDGSPRPISAALVATLAALRDAIALQLPEASRNRDTPALLRQVVRQARADDLRAEQVVVAFSDAWESLPGSGHAMESMRAEIRGRVVSALITAYYEGDATSPDISILARTRPSVIDD